MLRKFNGQLKIGSVISLIIGLALVTTLIWGVFIIGDLFLICTTFVTITLAGVIYAEVSHLKRARSLKTADHFLKIVQRIFKAIYLSIMLFLLIFILVTNDKGLYFNNLTILSLAAIILAGGVDLYNFSRVD